MTVFVLDKHHKPLMPCSEKRATHRLLCFRARTHKLHPFDAVETAIAGRPPHGTGHALFMHTALHAFIAA